MTSVTRTSPIERVVALTCLIRWNHWLHVPPRTIMNYTKISGNWHCVYSTSPVHSWIWLTTVNRSSAHLGKALATCKYQSFQTMKMRCVGQCAATVFCSWSPLMDHWRMYRGLHGPCNPDMAGRWGSRQESKLCLVLRVSPSVPACDNIWKCQILTRTDVQKFNMYYLDRELQKSSPRTPSVLSF